MTAAPDFKRLLAFYAIPEGSTSIRPYGNGHINDTYLIEIADGSDCGKLILQKTNKTVFHHPDEVMENISGVTSWLIKKITAAGGDPTRETMSIRLTTEGKPYYLDEDGEYWRIFSFVRDTVCLETITKPSEFYECGRAFGLFQTLLSDYPADTLHETIIDFHNTPVRFENFKKTLAEDPMKRAADVKPEIEFVLSREAYVSTLTDQIKSGDLPLRVTHNDTKLNNVLMDRDTMKAMCVVDLDTVMPGLVAYDFGDAIRYGATYAKEDEQDLTKVRFEFELFRAFAQGFLENCGSELTDAEWASLVDGCIMITLECGMRFFADHLDGDHYFKIHRDGQNLDRARTQFKLVSEMEAHRGEMEAILKEIRG